MAAKRFLIAGGSHSEIPLIKAARSLGYHVISGGNRHGDIGHRYSDEVVYFDYSDPEQVLSAFLEVKADFLCSGCNDFSAVSCSIVAERLSLPGHDSSDVCKTIHLKDKWRSFAESNGILSPHAIGYTNIEDAERGLASLDFPAIVKPVDLTGGKGIRRVDTLDEGVQAARDAFEISRAKRIVVEQFIDGSRHGLSCIMRDHKVAFYFVDDEIYYSNPYMVAAATSAASCAQSTIDAVIAACERTSRLLDLKSGLLHVQFIESESGKPFIIEVCRRAPGDLYVDLVQHATGACYSEWIVRAASDLSLASIEPVSTRNLVTRHCLMTDRQGVFRGFRFDPDLHSRIVGQLIWAADGDLVEDPLTHKFGIVFVQHTSAESARTEARALNGLLTALIE